MYNCNIEARSRNQCCRGYSICETYSESVSVALVIQRIMRMRCIILLSVAMSGYTVLSRVNSQTARFGGGGDYRT